MKKTRKSAIVLMLIAAVFMLASCDGLFTSSMMKGAARDPAEAAAKLSKQPTSSLVSSAGAAADQAQAQTVVNALSKKKPEEIKALPDEDKQTVITAAMTAVIDLTSMASEVDLESLMSEDSDADEDEMMNEIVGSIINNLGECDTTCVAVILEDYSTPEAINEATPEMKSSLVMGSVTVAASALKNSGFDTNDMDGLMKAFEGEDEDGTDAEPLDLVKKLIPEGSEQDQKNLLTALTTLSALSDAGYEFSDAFGMGSN